MGILSEQTQQVRKTQAPTEPPTNTLFQKEKLSLYEGGMESCQSGVAMLGAVQLCSPGKFSIYLLHAYKQWGGRYLL